MFDRQDSARMDYMAEREARHSFSGITQQTSVESTDSRFCYLTSSEVSFLILQQIVTTYITVYTVCPYNYLIS